MLVELKCVKVQGKLRVRILTDGYIKDANCQFPRDIRAEGRHYQVDSQHISLKTRSGRWFYSIMKKDCVKILTSEEEEKIEEQREARLKKKREKEAQEEKDIVEEMKNMTIYEDESSTECAVCMDADKDVVFYPCGHFYCCGNCKTHFEKCPICRVKVQKTIDRKLID